MTVQKWLLIGGVAVGATIITVYYLTLEKKHSTIKQAAAFYTDVRTLDLLKHWHKEIAANSFLKAVDDGDVQAVRNAIRDGSDVNQTKSLHGGGISPLMIAAAQGNLEIVQELIIAGADATASAFTEFPHAGYPVLRFAIDSSNEEVVQAILDAGGSPREDTEYHIPLLWPLIRNVTLISYALAQRKALSLIACLLASIDSVNYKEGYEGGSWTPLMVAAALGEPVCVQLLLEKGAVVNEVNYDDRRWFLFPKTAYDYATPSNAPLLAARGGKPGWRVALGL